MISRFQVSLCRHSLFPAGSSSNAALAGFGLLGLLGAAVATVAGNPPSKQVGNCTYCLVLDLNSETCRILGLVTCVVVP